MCLLFLLCVGCTVEPEPELPLAEPAGELDSRLGYGAECIAASECSSGLCAGGMCTEACSLRERVDSCQHVGAFCGPVADGEMACVGNVETGADGESAMLALGDVADFAIDTVDDADLFLLELTQPGSAELEVQAVGVDVQLELYNLSGVPNGEQDAGGMGESESLVIDVVAPAHEYLVVRNVGGTTGRYRVTLH